MTTERNRWLKKLLELCCWRWLEGRARHTDRRADELRYQARQQRSAARELDGLRHRMAANRAREAAREERSRPTLSLAIAALAVASALVVIVHTPTEVAGDVATLAVVAVR